MSKLRLVIIILESSGDSIAAAIIKDIEENHKALYIDGNEANELLIDDIKEAQETIDKFYNKYFELEGGKRTKEEELNLMVNKLEAAVPAVELSP
mgnify:CR=1 FL=1